MPRLFVATWPPDEVLDALAALTRPALPGLRWTSRDQWHVTLRFLGRVDDVAQVADALAALGPGGRADGRVGAVLGPAVGRFAHRVLQVPVSGLAGLAAAVVGATAGLGEPPEDREFAGHVTLARVAKAARIDLRRLAGEPVAGRWVVTDVCLVESHLGPSGARYEVLGRFPVAGSAP